jgi:threonine dehydratase
MSEVTLKDVIAAQKRICPHLSPTPLHRYSGIDSLIGTEVYVKHENYQPVGAFKIRGGINLAAQLTVEERERGLITASTGNHGQSVAYGARLFGAKARIVVPQGANPGKVAAMKGLGAEVIFHGEKFDDARLHSETLAEKHGYRFVHVGDQMLIAGVGTVTLEILERQPDIDVVIVPVGGGSDSSGACIVANAINPDIQVIGVQAAASPAAYKSWKNKKIIEAPNETFAEGLATGIGLEETQEILRERLDDFVLVSEQDIEQGIIWMLQYTHSLAEGAGASPLAAAYNLREQLKGKKVAVICSGGNLSLDKLHTILDKHTQS